MRNLPNPSTWVPVVIDHLAARPQLREAFPLADALDHAVRSNA